MTRRIARVIVKHGTTPTGVGVVLTGEGNLTLTSPCCGTLFYEGGQSSLNPKWSISAWCEGCKLEYTTLMFDSQAVLYHDAFLGEFEEAGDTGYRWLAGALGVTEAELKVTVE